VDVGRHALCFIVKVAPSRGGQRPRIAAHQGERPGHVFKKGHTNMSIQFEQIASNWTSRHPLRLGLFGGGAMRSAPIAVGSALLMTAVLSACGGGGGSGSQDVPATPLTVSGTAATGAAIAGKTVDVKCSSGTGSPTSNSNGGYSITVTGGSLPCLVRVTTDSGAVLHSVVAGAGSSATANVTPVSQLVVARLFAKDPAAAYASFDASAAAALTSSAVQAATTAVVQQLKRSGVDFSGVGDVLTAALTPATAGAGGNGFGQQLVALDASLTSSGTTLAELAGAVSASTATAAAASGTASLPADVLLRPKSANCAALRSGSYRAVSPTKGGNMVDQFGTFTVDAVAGTLLDSAPGSVAEPFTPSGPCRYGGAVVSQAGIIVSRFVENGQNRLLLAFPEQTIALAELAGVWNTLGFELNDAGTAYAADASTATIGSDGVVSAVSFCADLKNCVAVNAAMSLKTNAAGGFDLVNTTANYTDRYFAYRAGGGELMLVGVAGDGSFGVWTRKRTNGLPTVGTVAGNWNLSLDNQLLGNPALGEVTNHIDTVDAALGRYTRTQATVGANDAHSESLAINTPRDGYLFRAAATAPAADGSTATIREFTGLGLRGMGMTALTLPSLGWYMFSVAQP
jgi:hypothetical protein